MDYYVYAYLREDGTPYYIGKGTAYRAWDKGHNVPVPKDKSKIVMLEKNLTEVGSLALERFYIRWYGRKKNNTGILDNTSEGGNTGNPKTGRRWKKELNEYQILSQMIELFKRKINELEST